MFEITKSIEELAPNKDGVENIDDYDRGFAAGKMDKSINDAFSSILINIGIFVLVAGVKIAMDIINPDADKIAEDDIEAQ